MFFAKSLITKIKKPFRLFNTSSAFSLIEMAVVVVIISIMLAGLLASSSLVRKFKISAAQNLTTTSVVNGISGSVLWLESSLDKSFNDSETKNSGNLSVWRDIRQSVSKNDATQSSISSYPKYSNGINYIPAVGFSGSNYFTVDGSALNSTDYTIFVVEQRNSGQSNNYFIGDSSLNGSTLANQNLVLGYSDDGTVIHSQSSGNNYTSTTTTYSASAGRAKIFTFTHSQTLGKSTYINGSLASHSADTSNLSGISSLKIGKSYNGQLGEVIMFARTLDDDEIKSVEDYLSKKWNGSINRSSSSGSSGGSSGGGSGGGGSSGGGSSGGGASGGGTPSQNLNITYLIVGGGGSGGDSTGAGGGAGGLLTGTITGVAGTSYPVVVGSGGVAINNGRSPGVNGHDSSAFGLTAIGGGGGGGDGGGSQWNPGKNGGSGGGGTCQAAPGSGTAGQGYAGGGNATSWGGYYGGSGGGGAGGAGITGSDAGGGNGGPGYLFAITNKYYAGGGGGGIYYFSGNQSFAGRGGSGVGGTPTGVAATSGGAANTGSGGGGSVANGATSGNGADGVVIIAYPGAQSATGGNVSTVVYSGTSYTVHTFTSSGSFAVN